MVDSFADGEDRRTIEDAYCAAYRAFMPLLAELYDEVRSRNEILSVGLAAKRLERYPMADVDGSRMWAVGRDVRNTRGEREVTIDPLTAGVFCGAMVAQVDLLRAEGHPWSEIANESIIELVDSLIPYMHARGIAYMIDNCSTTARLGARKWEPRFETAITQQVLPALDGASARDPDLLAALEIHPVHEVLATIGKYRPSVDVAVT